MEDDDYVKRSKFEKKILRVAPFIINALTVVALALVFYFAK